ncbi:MAG: hypothetical protein JWM34_4936 [Ilumatobacteraceae bacterium]|nr:hypothetical protein [Ilumatobacteraceae bacterium]
MVAALLLGACSSSAKTTSQPDDDFLDKVETGCRDANKVITKLDKTDPSAPPALYQAVSDMSDVLDGLHAPSALSKDYDTYTSNIDEQVLQLKKITTAISAGDSTGEQAAVTQLNTLRSASDAMVDTLQIYSCLGIVPVDGMTAATTSTTVPDTSPDTSSPDTTSPPTEPPTTATPTTRSTTTDVTTDGTATEDTVLPADLSKDDQAPDGFSWIGYTPADVKGLYDNPSIGKLVTYYAGGEIQSSSDGSTATVYVVRLSQQFNDTYTKAYQYWEAVDNGKDVTTPGGKTVHQELGAFSNTDCEVYVEGDRGVTICAYTGYDELTLMDAYLAANPD